MKRLILTFDDGPDLRYTAKFLDIIKDEKIKATFFVVADNALNNPNLIERMKRENICIGLHSLRHIHPYLCGYRATEQDFQQSMDIMKELGCNVKFYRPPWGKPNLYTRRFLLKHNLHMVLWDVMARDWSARSTPELIARRIEKRVFDGAIICLHDSGDRYGGDKDAPFNTIDALKIVIPNLKKKGYEFITVEEFYQK